MQHVVRTKTTRAGRIVLVLTAHIVSMCELVNVFYDLKILFCILTVAAIHCVTGFKCLLRFIVDRLLYVDETYMTCTFYP